MQVNVDGKTIEIDETQKGIRIEVENDGVWVIAFMRVLDGCVEFSIFPHGTTFTEEILPSLLTTSMEKEIFIRIGEEPEGEE